MNVYMINGSPKGNGSNTLQLSRAFLEGMGSVQLRESIVTQLEIQPCKGCFACWNKTPGQCIFRDDMVQVLENIIWADVIIWSFPLYYFSVPGPLKTLIDRQLPMVLPFMEKNTESGGHPSRFDMHAKRHVVISTCGFYTAKGNYDGVIAVYDHLCGKANYTTIFCGQGELFRVKELRDRTQAYLDLVKQAGKEFVSGEISPETRGALEELLFPRETFEAMADASWGIEKTGEKTEETLIFTKQMAALYNKSAWSGKDIVLEMYYTDVNRRYQLLLTKDGHQVLTDNFLPYSTCIETAFSLWKSIAEGKISGQDALMERKYRVKGDFDLMIHWDRYFGQKKEPQQLQRKNKGTNMASLLIPWIALWAVSPFDQFFGAVVSMMLCAAMPLCFRRYRRTVYDDWSGVLVSLCAAALLVGISARLMLPVSYLFFGIMWTASCILPCPLTAHYSMNDYGGDEAMKNPLFIKTNRILTACWGVLYLLTPVWTYLLMGTNLAHWTGAINSVLPVLMGVFTGWFQKWYPAKVAKG